MMKEWGDPLFCLLIKQKQKKRYMKFEQLYVGISRFL